LIYNLLKIRENYMDDERIVLSLLNILDPLGIYEICPPDEYENEAEQIELLVKRGEYEQIKRIAESLYGGQVEIKKINELIRLLKILNDKSLI